MVTLIPQGVPQLSSPMVMENRAVTQPWYLFFISLWERTGGGTGTDFAPASGQYLVENASPSLPNADVVTNTPSVTWDFTTVNRAKANVVFTSISITESQVVNLTSDLAARALISTSISAGTGLTGGGSLAADRTISVATNGVTNALSAQMATHTIKGNNTAGTANAIDLTAAQVNAILPIFTTTLNGLVPLSGGGTTNFLRADATFANPLAGGISGTVTLAAITGGGTTGSITYTNGLITAVVAPT